MLRDVPRLAPLPSADNPFFVFLGVLEDRETLVFLLSSDVTATGDGKCRPSSKSCQTIELETGDTEFFDFAQQDGTVIQYQMDVLKVDRRDAATAKAAAASYARKSQVGQELLRMAAADDAHRRLRRLPLPSRPRRARAGEACLEGARRRARRGDGPGRRALGAGHAAAHDHPQGRGRRLAHAPPRRPLTPGAVRPPAAPRLLDSAPHGAEAHHRRGVARPRPDVHRRGPSGRPRARPRRHRPRHGPAPARPRPRRAHEDRARPRRGDRRRALRAHARLAGRPAGGQPRLRQLGGAHEPVAGRGRRPRGPPAAARPRGPRRAVEVRPRRRAQRARARQRSRDRGARGGRRAGQGLPAGARRRGPLARHPDRRRPRARARRAARARALRRGRRRPGPLPGPGGEPRDGRGTSTPSARPTSRSAASSRSSRSGSCPASGRT